MPEVAVEQVPPPVPVLRQLRAVGAKGYARVDMRLDEAGEPRVLEVNCNPCLDEDMGLARAQTVAARGWGALTDDPALVRLWIDKAR